MSTDDLTSAYGYQPPAYPVAYSYVQPPTALEQFQTATANAHYRAALWRLNVAGRITKAEQDAQDRRFVLSCRLWRGVTTTQHRLYTVLLGLYAPFQLLATLYHLARHSRKL